ncbi:beclin 1-associated autophagy-related key regulator isoform X2 [Eurytemora carolleeae]|uniref:beclin 1-associated autophagy-related key regulator isoform X2 n=1 Tax=Eurytemora carolleeae TaxID=1294199 RepID=UPI000C7921C2|nr:beclin 1-associated autophagy-related key regulator isoform X2 [Eurytemora carolleeae]|eukprot:XP_023344790.1 beclin 1-associated autophagy-related key regulator-like isoform X2 [Eurytemora affinis]
MGCIVSGDFVHSSTKFYERFSDKNLRFFSLQRDIRESKEQISSKIQDIIEKRRLREEIKQMKTKLKHIKHLIRNKTEKVQQTELSLQKLKSSNMKRTEQLPVYVSKVEKMRVSHEKFRSEHVRGKQNELGNDMFELSHIRLSLVQSLKDIFPIEEVYPCNPDQSDLMLDCLAEAMRTSYIHGRWVSTEQSGEMQYRVVSPLLTSSGDYTPVFALIATSKEGSVGVEPMPAFNISAGLTLLTQLIKLIAHITAVPLPIKLSYADFGVIDTSEYRFAKKVAKLNLNTISLSLALGVNPVILRPCQTVYNVITLVKHLLDSVPVSPVYGVDGVLEESISEFPYFALEQSEYKVSDWETEIHRESEELRNQEDEEEEPDWEPDEEHLQEWESVTSEDVSDTLSSSPSDHTLERNPSVPSSSLSFVSSTVSSLLWGIASPKSPRK